MSFQPGQPLTASREQEIDDTASTLSTAALASLLQDSLGQRHAANLLGLGDSKQLGRYQRADGPRPRPAVEMRMREAYKLVSVIESSFDAEIARSWLFGTNSRLGDEAPASVLRGANDPEKLARLRSVAREFVLSQATVRDPMADTEAVKAARAKPMADRLELALSWNLMASELRAGMAEQERVK